MDLILVFLSGAVLAGWLLFLILEIEPSERRLRNLVVNQKPLHNAQIVVARSFINTKVGLLNHAFLEPNQGLWLSGTKRIHTKGMLFPIDAVFVSKKGKILSITENIPCGYGRTAKPAGSAHVLETAAYTARNVFHLNDGDYLELR